jgi:hypothetical protein
VIWERPAWQATLQPSRVIKETSPEVEAILMYDIAPQEALAKLLTRCSSKASS